MAEANVKTEYSLNDDRRVKVLSPGALVAKRFFRNRLAIVGLVILIAMFTFSFVGGLISPYNEDQLFYRDDIQVKAMGGITENTELRLSAKDERYSNLVHAYLQIAIKNDPVSGSYEQDGKTYTYQLSGNSLYSVYYENELIGCAHKDIFSLNSGSQYSFEEEYAALIAAAEDKESEVDGHRISVQADGTVQKDGENYGFLSAYIINPISADVQFSRDFKEAIIEFLNNGNFARNGENEKETLLFVDENGVEQEYYFKWNAGKSMWDLKQEKVTRVYDTYAEPSKAHWLGTDGNGMDMLTRLMYGGRVSLLIGFIVEFISTFIGVILGGISGYFGGWVDNLIMRIVDIFYCIPSLPIIIILGAAMDAMSVDPKLRMVYLMLILGFLGWPGLARLVRGQILSLREQEFMTATEACGISVKNRIFKHLIPNVIPQLIVSCTMGLGGTIITEATLSFLGLGVKFPFASWGNIINDVNNIFVLTSYWFIWIPAGVLLLLTVLAFNIVGDGLRDAFDPKMKR